MDKLFDELANLLNVSTDLVQQFVGNYPQLRSQWQIYKVFDLWNDFLSFTAVIVLGVLIYIGFKYHSDLEYESEEEITATRKKWLKHLAVSFLVLCLVDYTLLSIQTYLAPDITMVVEALKYLR